MAILIGFDKFEKEKAELIKRMNETDLDVKSVVKVEVKMDECHDIVLAREGLSVRVGGGNLEFSSPPKQIEIKKYLLQKIDKAEYMDDLYKISNILSEINFMINKAKMELS